MITDQAPITNKDRGQGFFRACCIGAWSLTFAANDCFCHVRACGAICWGADKKHRRELRNGLRSRVHPPASLITMLRLTHPRALAPTFSMRALTTARPRHCGGGDRFFVALPPPAATEHTQTACH